MIKIHDSPPNDGKHGGAQQMIEILCPYQINKIIVGPLNDGNMEATDIRKPIMGFSVQNHQVGLSVSFIL